MWTRLKLYFRRMTKSQILIKSIIWIWSTFLLAFGYNFYMLLTLFTFQILEVLMGINLKVSLHEKKCSLNHRKYWVPQFWGFFLKTASKNELRHLHEGWWLKTWCLGISPWLKNPCVQRLTEKALTLGLLQLPCGWPGWHHGTTHRTATSAAQ